MKRLIHSTIAAFALAPCGCPMSDDDDPTHDDAGTPEDGSSGSGTETPDTETAGTEAPGSTSGEPDGSDDAGSCDSDGAPGSSDDGSDAGSSDTGGAAVFTVSGEVTRLASAPITEGNDGIGTLYIAAFAACAHGEPPLGIFALPEADFSSEANAVAWHIEGLPAGPVYFGLFLDDDGDAELPSPLPGPGDPSYADDVCDGVLSCIEVEIPNADVTDAALVLDATHTRC